MFGKECLVHWRGVVGSVLFNFYIKAYTSVHLAMFVCWTAISEYLTTEAQ